MRVALGVATFAATEFDKNSFMYFAELGYVSGFACFSIGVLTMLAYFVIGKTVLIVELLRRLEVMGGRWRHWVRVAFLASRH